jgi:hypothetical protein
VAVPASESEQDVPVAASPGTLSLEFTPPRGRPIGALIANGCKLSWFWFHAIPGALTAGKASSILAQATAFQASAGSYSLCGLEYGEFDEDAEIPPEACVSGVLPPGGSLQLRLNP